MDNAPAKKINFEAVGKENIDTTTTALAPIPVKGIPMTETVKKPEDKAVTVAPAIKEEEAHEPLLQENPHRFVLFPIKYHEVGVAWSTRHA
jgi:ribonucleoside-diphosphate reductase subunit M2